MTPQERQLVDQLFDRLATLENEPRDPDAEGAIRDGVARAPHALYALVQTALVQDEALRRANARIEALEAGQDGGPREQQGGFLDNLRNAMFGEEQKRGSGSVPTVRPGDAARPDSRWNTGQAMGVPPGYGRGPDSGWQGGPAAGPSGAAPGGAFGGGGGSFLGTAAAAAAGVIGGSLLLGAIRNVMGPAHAGQGALDPGTAGESISPWGGGAVGGDLSRQAGLDDIGGRQVGAYDDGNRDAGYDPDAGHDDDSSDYDDSDADFGDDTDFA
ncbi:MAG: DUF2076 domain-containing protein [Xanthobacteraceae bacterium]